jgi:hypothetical protein
VISVRKEYEKEEILKELEEIKKRIYDISSEINRGNILEHTKPLVDIVENNTFEIVAMSVGLSKKIKETHDIATELYRKIGKSISRIEFYYNDAIREKHEYTIEFGDDLTHMEDDMFHDVIDYIRNLHDFKVERVEFHKRIDGIEFDCIAHGRTYMGKFDRTIGIEFKDSDIETVVAQAVVRSGYTNVQYVVAKTSFYYLIEKMPTLIDELKKHKIGLILLINNKIPELVIKSDVKKKTKNKALEEYFNGEED